MLTFTDSMQRPVSIVFVRGVEGIVGSEASTGFLTPVSWEASLGREVGHVQLTCLVQEGPERIVIKLT